MTTVRLPRSADAASPDHPEATWRTFVPVPRALAVKQISPPGVADFGEGCLEGVVIVMQSAEYHRAAAARVRKLRADATTRWLKEHLEDEIVRHEQIAEEIERVSDPDGDAGLAEGETPALSNETPGR